MCGGYKMKSIKNLLTKSILTLLAISTIASSSLFAFIPEDKREKPEKLSSSSPKEEPANYLVKVVCQKDRIIYLPTKQYFCY